ncbi:hypothetical protein LSH36_251g00009 [Paralvinella palmiformis]|uniref:Ankyrin repeat domain-containing protein 66 n=1 Tax=Paralvinella palmiformis TaxID=53620 RepID=A0AAD9N355_9ANNE|nr:hypothetical protein LSH36_251g00009 [Paralvinella palmiformis]
MAGHVTGLELHEACTLGDYDALEEYMKSGKYENYINMKDPEWQNRTPIHWACSKGYVDCLRLLLEHGAKPNARMSMGWTPAHCAAETGKLHVLRALHNAGAAIYRKDKYGDTPKNVAQMYGHTECVKYLESIENERKSRSEEPDSEDDTDEDTDDETHGNT